MVNAGSGLLLGMFAVTAAAVMLRRGVFRLVSQLLPLLMGSLPLSSSGLRWIPNDGPGRRIPDFPRSRGRTGRTAWSDCRNGGKTPPL